MKNILYIIPFILLASCKSASPIITSKDEAQKRGIYTKNTQTASTTKQSETNTSIPYPSEKERKKNLLETNNNESLTHKLIQTALQFEGVRYKGGGTTKEGMDCSGLVCTTFNTHDIQLPRTSYEMASVGKKIKLNEVQEGDLLFFKTNGKSRINHVGLVTEVKNDEILFIHSSVQRGVIISSINEPYYRRTFSQANRVVNNIL